MTFPPHAVRYTDHEEARKYRAYPNTVLEFDGPPRVRVDLRAPVDDATRRALAALGLDAPFAIFTAENPEGANPEDAPSAREEARREEANERRTDALTDGLRAAGLFFTMVDGSAPDGSYRERCVAVVLPREDATALATSLRQLALFWFDGSEFWLLPADADQPPTRLPAAP